MAKLTPKQRRFIAAYTGNGTEAARAAGYKGTDATLGQVAHENLRKPEIRAAVDERLQRAENRLIANREERQGFWTSMLRDGAHDISARLKASELLGKSDGDFKERVEVDASESVLALLLAARKRDESE